MSAPVLVFTRISRQSSRAKHVEELATDAVRQLVRLAGAAFVERFYLNPTSDLQQDIACFRRHPAERWDVDAHCWRAKRARGRKGA